MGHTRGAGARNWGAQGRQGHARGWGARVGGGGESVACEGAGDASGALSDVAIEDTLKVQAIFRLFFICLMQAIP